MPTPSVLKAKSKQKSFRFSFLNHFITWNPVYQAIGALGVVTAIIFGGITIQQTQKSLLHAESSFKLTQKSVEIQQSEYLLRNRPLLVIREPRFGTRSTDSKGQVWPFSISFDVFSLTEVPATEVHGSAKIQKNGNWLPLSDFNLGVIANNRNQSSDILLNDERFKAVKDTIYGNTIILELFYSGLLGESVDQYKTTVQLNFRPAEERFTYSVLEIK